MAFPNAHLYLTLHWHNSAAPLETGQTGIRFDSTTAASQALVDGCATAVSNFWGASTAAVPTTYKLDFLRLASVAADGRYVAGTIAFDKQIGAQSGGVAATGAVFPLQVAAVATLRTALPRGQAHAGRLFLPPFAIAIDATTSRWDATTTLARANALGGMLTALNTALPGKATVFSKGTVRSNTGSKALVTGVQIGGRPDVQRRRAKGVAEVYSTLVNVV